MQVVNHSLKDKPAPIPLTVLTGFLGAGKTTLLNRILTGDHGLRVAVLVNDFGSINIDAELVVGVESEGDVINLANGCVCCNIRDDLVAAVTQVMTRAERPEYILLEASGVADPSGIALTFMDEGMRDRIRLDSIMCVVDAEQIFAAPEMMELKLRQVAFADMLILNKVDLVTPEEIERIKAWLDDRFHRYRLVQTSRGNVPLEILLSVGRFDPSRLDATPPHEEPSHPPDCDDPDCGHHVHGHRQRSRAGLQDVELRNGRAVFHWKRCGKRRASFRPAFTDAKAWFIPPKNRADGSSFRLSASEWISQLGMNGMAGNHGPGSSPSEHTMEWMELRCAKFLTDAVMQRASQTTATIPPVRVRIRSRIPHRIQSLLDEGPIYTLDRFSLFSRKIVERFPVSGFGFQDHEC